MLGESLAKTGEVKKEAGITHATAFKDFLDSAGVDTSKLDIGVLRGFFSGLSMHTVQTSEGEYHDGQYEFTVKIGDNSGRHETFIKVLKPREYELKDWEANTVSLFVKSDVRFVDSNGKVQAEWSPYLGMIEGVKAVEATENLDGQYRFMHGEGSCLSVSAGGALIRDLPKGLV